MPRSTEKPLLLRKAKDSTTLMELSHKCINMLMLHTSCTRVEENSTTPSETQPPTGAWTSAFSERHTTLRQLSEESTLLKSEETCQRLCCPKCHAMSLDTLFLMFALNAQKITSNTRSSRMPRQTPPSITPTGTSQSLHNQRSFSFFEGGVNLKKS